MTRLGKFLAPSRLETSDRSKQRLKRLSKILTWVAAVAALAGIIALFFNREAAGFCLLLFVVATVWARRLFRVL